MDARAHPRTNLRLHAITGVPGTGTRSRVTVENISLGGLFVRGVAGPPVGKQLQVAIGATTLAASQAIPLDAHSVRSNSRGFALHFDTIDSHSASLIEKLMHPDWDGRNLFDGLLIAATHEQLDSLAQCLQLSSVISGRYRNHCSINREKQHR